MPLLSGSGARMIVTVVYPSSIVVPSATGGALETECMHSKGVLHRVYAVFMRSYRVGSFTFVTTLRQSSK
jgi:hypothetical protein